MKRRVLRIIVAALVVMGGVVPAAAAQAGPASGASSVPGVPGGADAAATGLWHCPLDGDGYTYACTTIKKAPSGGVRVLDRVTGQVYTLHNGNSVALDRWYTDTSGRCGVHGNSYVWSIIWSNNERHQAFIGDYYLNTGTVSNWSTFSDSWGPLGEQYGGRGSGTCDIFP
jgi:hypothetical protein